MLHCNMAAELAMVWEGEMFTPEAADCLPARRLAPSAAGVSAPLGPISIGVPIP
jgi:hypothetical protein